MDDDPSDPLSAPDNCWFTFADFDAVLGDDSERSGATEGFQYGELDTIHFDLEKLNRSRAELNTDVDYFRGRGHSQSYLEEASDFKRENLNDVIDSGSDASLHPLQDSSKRLRLSCDLVNSSRGSTFCANNFDQPKPQKNIKECAVSVSNGVGAGLSYSATADVNDIYSKSEMNSNEQQGHAISFQTGYEEFESHVENVFPPSELPNGETSSPRGPPLKFFGLSGEMHNSHSSGALPGSIVEDRNMYSSLPMESMVSCIDPSVPVTDVINPESCTFDAANNTCNGGSNIILHRDCTGDVDDGLYQTSQVQFPASCPVENEKCNRRVDHLLSSQNSDWTSNVRLSRNGEYSSPVLIDLTDSFEVTNNTCNGSNNTILDTDYVSDMEYGLDQTSAAQFLPYSDDTSLISESSTDSSPILSSRNSTSDHVDGCTLTNVSNSLVSCSNRSWQSMPRSFMSSETGNQFLQSCYEQHKILKDGSSSAPKHFSGSIINVEDDNDLCILDNVSDYVSLPRPPSRVKMLPISQRPEFTNPHYHTNGGMGLLRADDERLTFQIAMQDLSQPRSEISPPDGVLAVPLLRHQRIALSWMVQKETTGSLKCAGGILADDQGLGKTVSTIALILMERSPSSRSSTVVKKEDEFETLNLDDDDDDDDDDEDTKVNVMKQTCSSYPILMSNLTKPMKDENSVSEMKSRPAAGTLVVCPTSVLRQWADELQAKVTSKANLSFLVYHGSNRTKDPNELAKYDVVLTTYAIVSMEVPKQPLVDKDDEEKRQHDASGASSVLLNCRKRKASPTSSTKNRKGRSKMDHAMLESTARPLGRVGWFRVVLDEAQSIKNHRTQVARACWGLRAKRRWCLSGTPIQNSIDDLYSYFRFLRYDPYAVYQSFCSTIKMPISRNPTNGYKKLQAVLNTIMLRRTKGTLLDGKPIITLPPKKISLKKVDFSAEERDFYSTLEAESREQFMEYEDAGTVKQNYVNILLMLLRLRQACDHPLLVKDCDSNSNQRSSLEMAKKLPRDKKIVLLSCLEVSLAICAICNDPPEDAVVTICGHVFCNQCICAHLTSEENICPSPNCKVLLTAASVFSRRTLKSCLSDQLGDESYSGGSDFDMGDKHKKWENNWSSSSSKIKVALEILQSLPKSQCQSTSNVEKSDVESLCSSVKPTNLGWSSPDLSGLTQTTLEKYSTCNVSEKAIIFSQWTRMLDLLEAPLKASCIQYRRLDGTMSVAAREKAVKDFNTLPEVTVIIMSLKAASLGLNLVAANHVLLLDLWWNPTTEDQAIDRAHRIGQARPVTVSRLTVKDTVEDKILSLQEKKREMVASAFGEDESGSRQTRLTMEDMRYIFMT